MLRNTFYHTCVKISHVIIKQKEVAGAKRAGHQRKKLLTKMKKIRLKHLFTPLSTSSHSTLTLFPLHKLTRSTKNKGKNRNQVKEKAPYKLSSTLLHQIRKKKGPPSLDFIFCSNWLFSFGTGILERVTTSVSIVICK